MKSKRTPFLGTWRITEMEQWDLDYIDEEEEGYFESGKGEQGDFHFGLVQGSIDYELETVEGKQRLEFTFDGTAEMDETTGRGWARMEPDGTLYGKIAFHMGDKSWFRAKRKK